MDTMGIPREGRAAGVLKSLLWLRREGFSVKAKFEVIWCHIHERKQSEEGLYCDQGRGWHAASGLPKVGRPTMRRGHSDPSHPC